MSGNYTEEKKYTDALFFHKHLLSDIFEAFFYIFVAARARFSVREIHKTVFLSFLPVLEPLVAIGDVAQNRILALVRFPRFQIIIKSHIELIGPHIPQSIFSLNLAE